MDDTPESKERLRIASSQPLSLVERSRETDPEEDPLAYGTPRPALTSIVLRTDGDRVEATATLAIHGRILSATNQGDASERAAVVAGATLQAVLPLLDCPASIESAQVLDICGRDVALSVIRLEPLADTPGSNLNVLVGSALVRGDFEDATARSVLSALNRRLSR